MPKLILFLFLAVASLVSVPLRAQQPAPTDPIIERVFGRPGEAGSFRARFNRRGGGLISLHLLDHYRSIEARDKKEHDWGDYMLLVWNSGNHAMRLNGTPQSTGFPPEIDLMSDEWHYREFDDGVEFWLESGNGITLRRTLRHEPESRGFELTIALENTGHAGGGQVAFELIGPALVNPATTRTIGNASTALVVPIDGDPIHVGPDRNGAVQHLVGEGFDPHRISFAGSTSRFFGAFLTPRNEEASRVLSGFDVDTGPSTYVESLNIKPNTVTSVRYQLVFPMPEPNGKVEARFGLYFGPKSYRVFDTLPDPERFAPILDIDLTAPCCQIPGGRAMAKLLMHLLSWFYDLVGNWGLSIIMLTILVRGMLMPLNFRMQKSMRQYGAKMAKLKPKLDELKKRHENDQKAYQQAMLALQREHKMIPPIGGCLPMFLTMPVYIGLFTALRVAYDLRQQPFALWIQDLSLPDSLAPLPFWPHVLNLLPLLWIGLFLFMSLRQPLPTDPQQRSVQRMMRFMPLIFGFMLYGYASALLLYMVTSMLWSLAESAMVKKILGPVDPNVASMTPTPI